jgi:hypothetical protein
MERPEARALGLTTYYTGRSCKNGHRHERYTKTGACVICQRDAAARDRAIGERYKPLSPVLDPDEIRKVQELAYAKLRAEGKLPA